MPSSPFLASACNSRAVKITAALTLAALTLAPRDTAAEEWIDKFQFHGFMTQAFAVADYTDGGPTPNEVILGIDEDGTSDYRFLALQFRYEISPDDLLVVQLSSRSLGDSPISKIEDEIELDWAFYERKLADRSSIKVGRIQIPVGIFNEVRDVGTLLPFYRPAFTFYREGSFTSETVDGLLVHHVFFDESDWSLDTSAFFGEYELVEQAVFVPDDPPALATAENVRGIQLWLSTPVSGLRFGLGGQKRNVTEGQERIFRPVGKGTPFDDTYASIEYSGNRFMFRGEIRRLDAVIDSPLFGFKSRAIDDINWFHVGFYATDKIHLFAQREASRVTQESDAFVRDVKQDQREDIGIALNYRFSSNVVVKAEYHWVQEEGLRFVPNGAGLLSPVSFSFDDGNYSILSLALSF